MFKTFSLSFRLRITYRVNSILHSLRSMPLLGKLFSSKLYASRALKTLAYTLSAIGEVFSVFLGKALYLGALFLLATQAYSGDSAATFLHLLVLLTITGGVTNTFLFDPSRDKYYAIVLMRMDARDYALTNYFYFLGKTLVGFTPFCLLFGGLAGLPLWLCALLGVYVCAVKLCFAAITLLFSHDERVSKNENAPSTFSKIVIFSTLALAVIPPIFSFSLPRTAALAVMALFAAAAAPAFIRIRRFPAYRAVYKRLLRPEAFALGSDSVAKMTQQNLQKKLITDASITSNKSGYAYLNDLFVKRHAKMLTRSAKRITLALAAIAAAVAVATVFLPSVREGVNTMLLRSLPVFLWIMYFLNRGQQITRAMFMNCDHSMLSYRFFRQKDAILLLFSQRLRSVVRINLMPAAVLAVGLPALLAISGGTEDALNYVVLCVSILAMSVFFSVHSMVLYYLLQPYNLELESKGVVYNLANSITYIICYLFIRAELPTLTFGICTAAFCILYVAVALLLAYRLAPKTFHLR